MLNPLSLQIGQTCSGKEINDWCRYQIENNGSHYKDAVRLLKRIIRMIENIIKLLKLKLLDVESLM